MRSVKSVCANKSGRKCMCWGRKWWGRERVTPATPHFLIWATPSIHHSETFSKQVILEVGPTLWEKMISSLALSLNRPYCQWLIQLKKAFAIGRDHRSMTTYHYSPTPTTKMKATQWRKWTIIWGTIGDGRGALNSILDCWLPSHKWHRTIPKATINNLKSPKKLQSTIPARLWCQPKIN